MIDGERDEKNSCERRNLVAGGNDAFDCGQCGESVRPLVRGSIRNHCPACLWSRHVDKVPGDRAETCRGLMEPVRLEGTSASGWKIIHRCVDCGFERANKATLDDPEQPDDWDVLMELAGG